MDLIFMGSDYQAFLDEAVVKSPEIVGQDEEGNPVPLFNGHSGVVQNENGFLINVRDGNVGAFARCQTTTNMGDYASVFDSPTKDADYQTVWPYGVEQFQDDGEGNLVGYFLPKRFVIYAGDV